MALRLLEIIVPEMATRSIVEIMRSKEPPPPHWVDTLPDHMAVVMVILDQESLEEVTDAIEARFRFGENTRILIHPLEAVIPRLISNDDDVEDDDAEREGQDPANEDDPSTPDRRLHREELYSGLYDEAKLTRNHLLLVVLAAIVAALGLMRNSEVILVGAMVIAPLLGPQLAMAFAGVMGDWSLLRQALGTTFSSVVVGLAASACIGFFTNVDPSASSMELLTSPGIMDLLVALAAGAAGTLCFTMGQATAVVGVMVAAALMPPLAAAGLLLGQDNWAGALAALALFAANIVGINAAGMAVCLYQGVRPGSRSKRQTASKAATAGMILWLVLLSAMAGVLWWFFQDKT